eukprot:9490100-Pyramimonas_sp.AAC.1
MLQLGTRFARVTCCGFCHTVSGVIVLVEWVSSHDRSINGHVHVDDDIADHARSRDDDDDDRRYRSRRPTIYRRSHGRTGERRRRPSRRAIGDR